MERGGRVHDPFEDTNLRHVKQIVGREMEEEWTYELSNYNIVPFYLLFFFSFFFSFENDSRLNFDTRRHVCLPLPFIRRSQQLSPSRLPC